MAKRWAAAVIVAGVLALGALPAGAHVGASPGEVPADGYSTISFSVPHGCDGSPTTAITIVIPDGIDSTTPAVNPGWAISTETEPLGDAGGGEGAERTTAVTWTAEPGNELPDDQMTTFAISLKTPAAEGETLYFNTIQTCDEGETRWFDEDPESDTPAPAVALTASTGGHGSSAEDDDGDGDGDEASAAVDTSDLATTSDVDSARTVGIIGIVVGAIGIVLGLVALLRKPKTA